MLLYRGLGILEGLLVTLGVGLEVGLEHGVPQRFLDEEGPVTDGCTRYVAAQHREPVHQFARDLLGELLEELAAGQGTLQLLLEVDRLPVLHEAVLAAPDECDELPVACDLHLLLIGGVLELQRGTLVHDALGHEEDGRIDLPLKPEQFEHGVGVIVGRLMVEVDQGGVPAAPHEVVVKTLVEGRRTHEPAHEPPYGLHDGLEEGEGASEDQGGGGKPYTFQAEVEEKGVH